MIWWRKNAFWIFTTSDSLNIFVLFIWMIQVEFILLDVGSQDEIIAFPLLLAAHCFLSWKLKLKKGGDVIYTNFYHLSFCQAWFSLLPPVNWLSDKDFNWTPKTLQEDTERGKSCVLLLYT